MDPSYQGRVPQVPYSRPGGRSRISPRALLMIIVVIVAIIVGAVMLTASGDKSGPLQQRLSARLATLKKMADEGDKNIKGGDLREFNSRLRIQIISDQKTIGDALTEKKASKEVTANEADTASFDALKDAQLNSRFDDAYRKLIAQKLDSTMLLMKELHDESRSKSLKAALNQAYISMDRLATQLTTPAQ